MPDGRGVFYLCGPTASGKTAFGMDLAKAIPDIVFVNADTMQLYRGLEPLAAHPSSADMARAEHRMFGVLSPREPFGRRQWLSMAMGETDRILDRGKIPVLVGGSRSLAAELARAAWDVDLPMDQRVAPTFQAEDTAPQPHAAWRGMRLISVMRTVGDLEGRVRSRLAANRQAAIRCVGKMLATLGDDLDHAALWTLGFDELRACLGGRMGLDEAEDAITARTLAYAAEQRAIFAHLGRAVRGRHPSRVLELHGVDAAQVGEAADFIVSG